MNPHISQGGSLMLNKIILVGKIDTVYEMNQTQYGSKSLNAGFITWIRGSEKPLTTYHNLKFLFYHKVSVGQSPIPFIAMAFFFFHFSLMGFLQVVYVYMKYEYNWNSLLIGMYDSINGIIQVII